MKTLVIRLLAVLLGAALPSIQAQMQWTGGDTTFTFTHGDGSADETLTLVPPQSSTPPLQFNRTYTGPGFTATAKGGVSHSESSRHALVHFPCHTGVWQTGNGTDDHLASALNVSGIANWTALNPFGPTIYGVALFPDICGTVAEGKGSFAAFSIHAEWGPDAYRSVLDYNYTITTPGNFEFAYFDWEVTTPLQLLAGEAELFSYSITFDAWGIDGLSSIYLRCRNPGDPIPQLAPGSDPVPPWELAAMFGGGPSVPEPSTYGLAGVAALGIAIYLRNRRRAG